MELEEKLVQKDQSGYMLEMKVRKRTLEKTLDYRVLVNSVHPHKLLSEAPEASS
jgi:hypothetical protein